MSDISLVLERTIDAPTDAVWRVLTDVEGSAAVLSGVTRVERLAGVGYTIGTRWRETRSMLGREATEELEVVGIDEGRSTMLAAEANGLAYRTEFTLEPVLGAAAPAAGAVAASSAPVGAQQTLLRMRFSGSPVTPSWVQRAMARLTARIGLAVTRKAMQQDLDDIAAAAEAA